MEQNMKIFLTRENKNYKISTRDVHAAWDMQHLTFTGRVHLCFTHLKRFCGCDSRKLCHVGNFVYITTDGNVQRMRSGNTVLTSLTFTALLCNGNRLKNGVCSTSTRRL
jgi:hypothetical protein